MQIDACVLGAVFVTHVATLDVSLGFQLTSEIYNSDQSGIKQIFLFFIDIFWAFCAFMSHTGQLKSGQETGERVGE